MNKLWVQCVFIMKNRDIRKTKMNVQDAIEDAFL